MPLLASTAIRRLAMASARSSALAGLALVALAAAPASQAIAEPPRASFLWFPSAPHTGEPVSFASTSTDATSPITGFAWDLAGDGAFGEGGEISGTTFSTSGSHVVQLKVTAADGSSSIDAETIQVSPPPVAVMLPFPVVRIVGTPLASGIRLRLLTVEAPPGARVTLDCGGRGCPAKSESLVAAPTSVETVTVRFRRYERSLAAGVVLELRVSKPGEIGKYTRFLIRRRRPPTRLDECLGPAGATPITCPAAVV
jgi:PKD repeat protein